MVQKTFPFSRANVLHLKKWHYYFLQKLENISSRIPSIFLSRHTGEEQKQEILFVSKWCLLLRKACRLFWMEKLSDINIELLLRYCVSCYCFYSFSSSFSGWLKLVFSTGSTSQHSFRNDNHPPLCSRYGVCHFSTRNRPTADEVVAGAKRRIHKLVFSYEPRHSWCLQLRLEDLVAEDRSWTNLAIRRMWQERKKMSHTPLFRFNVGQKYS